MEDDKVSYLYFENNNLEMISVTIQGKVLKILVFEESLLSFEMSYLKRCKTLI